MKRLSHRFVEEIPDALEDGVLYVSLEYNTVAHLCACGCGCETVTPLGRTEWRLTYDGESVSLSPSVGNWSLPCRSHYVVRDGLVHWAGSWTKEEVEAGREGDRRLKAAAYDLPTPTESESKAPPEPARPRSEIFGRVAAWIRGWWS